MTGMASASIAQKNCGYRKFIKAQRYTKLPSCTYKLVKELPAVWIS